MRKPIAAAAAGLMGIGMALAPVAAPPASAYIECGPFVTVEGNGGQRCADYRPDGSVWWRDTVKIWIPWPPPRGIYIDSPGHWYPAPPP